MRGQGKAAFWFLLPFLVLFSTFVLFPMAYGFWISLHKWHVLSKDVPFVGFQNYGNVVQDDLFRIALVRTALFVVMVVPLGNIVSLAFAVGLNQNFRGVTLFKIFFYLPTLLSVAVVALVWRWMYSAEFGLLNDVLSDLAGSRVQVPWLSSPKWVMPSVVLLSVWWGAGGNMLVYLAALKAVPKEMMEAASLDGASSWRRFWQIVMPTIKPVLLFCLVMSIIGSFQVFGQSYILTGGGPNYSSLTVVLYMYQMGFGQYQLGYASAVAYVLFAIVLVFTLVVFRLLRPDTARS
ncbi:sugar ABC transporter permease [bacterium]|nr:MAG: sugar ABC transporter permease [bacterium]